MSDRGFIGAAPEQKRHLSKGVFSLAEINEFQNINEYENDKIIASYTLVGGGGGGGTLSYSLRLSYEGLSVTSVTQTSVRAIVMGDN